MTVEKNMRLAIGRKLRSRDFWVTWVLPLAFILGLLALYVASEHRIYFYDPRGFQEVAMGASGAIRRGPYELYEWLRAQSLGEYPPYWSLPLAVLPPEVLNLRVPYEMAMGALGLLPLSVFTTKIACRIFGLRVTPWMVLVAGLNPLAFLVCVQGVPDLIGMSLILAASWILISRPMERSTLFWALLVGAGALLVKKNFLFDLAAVVACYMLAFAVAALRYRHPPERWRNLLTEVLSLRVLFAAAAVVAGTAILTPGTLSSIFGRDNSLFYVSYQTSLGYALSSNLSYAGGFVALALAFSAIAALAMLIARRTSPPVTRNAVFVAMFLVCSEILWAFVQKQAGIIHQVHVWPLLMMLGFVGLVRVVPRPRPVIRQGIALVLAAVLFVFMYAPAPALNGMRIAASRLSAGMYPNVTEPFVQTNFGNLIAIATTVRTLSGTDGPVLVPIASTAFNSSLLYQAYVQQVGTPIPDIYQPPQVDLRDALPWSTLIGDDGRTVLVSRDWVPDLPDGHRNLQAMNEFLDSPAAHRWIRSSQPLDAGVPGQLSDLRVIHLVIPEGDALTFAAAVQPFLPVSADHGLQGAVALLTDHDRRTEGPSAQTPTLWTATAGSFSEPTRLLVEGAATGSISLGVKKEGCDGLRYEWTVLGQSTTSPPVTGVEANEGTLQPGATQTLQIPGAGQGGGPWSHVLTLGVDGQTTGCQVSVSAES
ncbi:hypothetical protein [Arthrobacter sp. 754]|uniref:hypothetical protein n=1 Tax=Arthrobacter sp. 754 TaxID=3156315 RepID=UPI003399C9DF